jgi:D-arabinose 1-dehydrogenase-like Zn-dependent alcohol dehydrogenase
MTLSLEQSQSSMSVSFQPKNIRTKALVVEAPGSPFVLRNIVLDEVRDDEVLIEMKYTGLCHTVSSIPQNRIVYIRADIKTVTLLGHCRATWCNACRRVSGCPWP